MIIIGYQGIGKSTLAGNYNCIDLESGNFWVDGKRDENWYIPYCNIAEHLSKQGFIVFTSSHQVVRDRLANSEEKVFCVFPSVVLRKPWIQKLKERWERTKLDKDYKAYMNAEDRYADNIIELLDFKNTWIIHSMNYDLLEIVKNIEELE